MRGVRSVYTVLGDLVRREFVDNLHDGLYNCTKCSSHTVDGGNPAPPGMYK